MRGTPRTDLEFPDGWFVEGDKAVAHARQLERELAAANEKIVELRENGNRLKDAADGYKLMLSALKRWSPEHLGCDRWKKDAERYQRIRENWIDCAELGLHGRLVVIDTAIDVAIKERQPKPSGRIEVTQEMVERYFGYPSPATKWVHPNVGVMGHLVNRDQIRAMLEYVLGGEE